MAPYQGTSFDNSYTAPSSGLKQANQEDVIFDLTERLRERESEIRHLRQDKAELENQLILRGNPIKLDVAYEELLAHLKQREEDFRADAKGQEDQLREVERENRKLKDKLHSSRKVLNEQEQILSVVKETAREEISVLQRKVDSITRDNKDKDRQIMSLQDMVEGLTLEADQSKKDEMDDKELINRLGQRVEDYIRNTSNLEQINEELESRVETQRHILKEKEDEIIQLERFRDQREDELNDDLDRMRARLNEVIDSQRIVLDDKEAEIDLLYRQIDRYEDIIDEADYVTHEQRAVLKANKKEIGELSLAIERVQNSGLLGQLDKMCSSGHGS